MKTLRIVVNQNGFVVIYNERERLFEMEAEKVIIDTPIDSQEIIADEQIQRGV